MEKYFKLNEKVEYKTVYSVRSQLCKTKPKKRLKVQNVKLVVVFKQCIYLDLFFLLFFCLFQNSLYWGGSFFLKKKKKTLATNKGCLIEVLNSN